IQRRCVWPIKRAERVAQFVKSRTQVRAVAPCIYVIPPSESIRAGGGELIAGESHGADQAAQGGADEVLPIGRNRRGAGRAAGIEESDIVEVVARIEHHADV